MSVVPAADPDIDLAAFERGQIDPAKFDHRAHVYVAWRLLQEGGLPHAIVRFTAGLHRLTVRLGIPEKYNETITWFFLITMAERCAACPDADWPTFCARNADLVRDGSALLKQYYSTERLRSALARRQFLLPDLARESAVDTRTAPRSAPAR